MSRTKHTPGPWTVMRTPSGYDHIRGPNGKRISHECSDLDDLDAEGMANAYLIAAAPELLEACRVAVAIFSERLSQTDDMRPIYDAIAKATGGAE